MARRRAKRAGKAANRERDGRADKNVPGKGDVGTEEKSGGKAGAHADDGGPFARTAGENAEQEDAEQSAIEDGRDGKAGFEDATPVAGEQTDAEENDAPGDGSPASEPHIVAFGIGRAELANEIHDGGGGKGIESGTEIRHGGGEDRGDGEARDTDREMGPDELGIHTFGNCRSGDAGVAVINKQQYADEEKERELKEDHNPAGEECKAAIALGLGGEEPLHE